MYQVYTSGSYFPDTVEGWDSMELVDSVYEERANRLQRSFQVYGEDGFLIKVIEPTMSLEDYEAFAAQQQAEVEAILRSYE